MKTAWRPTKGGDGGAAPAQAVLDKRVVDPSAGGRRIVGGSEHIRDNERVVIVCVDRRDAAGLVETTDPFDRAHGRRRGAMLMAAARSMWVNGRLEVRPSGFISKARRYPPALLTQAGLSIDAAADALYELQRRLEGIPGIGCEDTVGELSATAQARLVPQRGFPS